MTKKSKSRMIWGVILAVVALLAMAELNLPHLLRFGQKMGISPQLPVMTLLLFIALLVLQPLVQHLLPASEEAGFEDPDQVAARAAKARIYVWLLLGVLCTAAGGIVLFQARNLSPAGGKVAEMDLSRPADPKQGLVKVVGARPLGAVLRYEGSGLDFGPATRFLPVQGAHNAGPAWLVVQLPDDGLTFDPQTVSSAVLSGLLVPNVLPASVEDGLRRKNALIKGDYWVLFTNPDELYAQYKRHASLRFSAALLFLLFTAVQWGLIYRQSRLQRNFSIN